MMGKSEISIKKLAKPALFWNKERNGIRCVLCERKCFISKGKRGVCFVRINEGNKLYTLNYGYVLNTEVEPIEKHHVFHFYPGSKTFVVYVPGNLIFPKEDIFKDDDKLKLRGKQIDPEKLVGQAKKKKVKSILFRDEATLSSEYIIAVARNARRVNIKTLFVTKGLVSVQAIKKLSKFIDGIIFEIDASLSKDFYKNFYNISAEKIKSSIIQAKKNRLHIEIVNRIIPQVGDDMQEVSKFAQWISGNLGTNIPLHFTRFFPDEIFPELPMTTDESLEEAWNEARRVGLRYVYIDEMPGSVVEDTYCFNCRTLLVDREGYRVNLNNVVGGRCPRCGIKIDIVSD